MSKRRQNVPEPVGDLPDEPVRDLGAWVVFTQLKDGGPHLFAGWLEAIDADMALDYAREHYGQDQPCVNVWVIDRRHLVGTDLREPDERGGETRPWIVLFQPEPGDIYRTLPASETRTVDAATSRAALEAARALVPDAESMHGIWVVPESCIVASAPDDLIWRHVDQGYRLARGYSKDVREKWQAIREQRAIEEYEKDDLQDVFADR